MPKLLTNLGGECNCNPSPLDTQQSPTPKTTRIPLEAPSCAVLPPSWSNLSWPFGWFRGLVMHRRRWFCHSDTLPVTSLS